MNFTNREAACCIEKPVAGCACGISDAAPECAERLELCSASVRCNSRRTAYVRMALDVCPRKIAFETEDPRTCLPIVPERAADQAAFNGVMSVPYDVGWRGRRRRYTGIGLIRMAPAITAFDTEITARPVIDGNYRRLLGVRPRAEIRERRSRGDGNDGHKSKCLFHNSPPWFLFPVGADRARW